MLHAIHRRIALWIPQIHLQDIVMAVNLAVLNLFSGVLIGDDQLDTRWRRDGAAVLVAEAAHAGAVWLLLDDEGVGEA